MDTIFLRPAMVFACIGFLFFISCDKDDDNSDISSPEEVRANVESGTWRIAQFIDSGKDETHHFAGYTFIFESSGSLIASNGTNNYEGTWSITHSSSSDDSQEDVDFNIHFNLLNDFEDLNDDWDVVSNSNTKIELIDVSGGNGGTDHLVFEKN